MGVGIGVGLVPIEPKIIKFKKSGYTKQIFVTNLNEDDFVVFLVDWGLERSLWADLFWLWWWNMDVNVFLYYSLATASEGTTSETASYKGYVIKYNSNFSA